ncbi:MAG: HAMP domain-containing sensor histidine kinase [Corynebacterium sp.]|nr:HAMP domain-containing sensor histidine kinase [Corynebacterium sp.]
MGSRFRHQPTLPLRTSLVIIVLIMAALAIGGTTAAVSGIMRGYIYDRVDERLVDAATGWALQNDLLGFNPNGGFGTTQDYYVLRTSSGGTTTFSSNPASAPDLTQVKPTGRPQTVDPAPSSASTAKWRVISVADARMRVTVAMSLEGEQSTLDRLRDTQLLIGLASLLLIALLSLLAIRRALAPLAAVEDVALAIADGDLDRRVPTWSPDTEVGHLAAALNTMLEKVQESVDEATTKEEQMRQFVGDASHELRTPLTSVKGYAELYKSGATDDVDLVLSRITDEAGRMSSLVEDLLALTRAEGRPHREDPVDVSDVVMSVASSLRAAYPGHEITVTPAPGAIVSGEMEQIRRVFTNLVANGIIHGGADVAITVRVDGGPAASGGRDGSRPPASGGVDGSRPPASGGRVVTTVSDNGAGMKPEDVGHIFDRFYRADASRSRKSGGSGLGLAISKGLVESHGGTITVTSKLGEGSVFTVTFPRRS